MLSSTRDTTITLQAGSLSHSSSLSSALLSFLLLSLVMLLLPPAASSGQSPCPALDFSGCEKCVGSPAGCNWCATDGTCHARSSMTARCGPPEVTPAGLGAWVK
eukprot:RCo028541